jgi:hypothetical protein
MALSCNTGFAGVAKALETIESGVIPDGEVVAVD